jgi:N-acetylgalactosamine-N,N'-diacetylbacillosaminyl-diphospho-undecaprenol 4-alpha-N-acetylgalactosaminyltransferase
MIIPNKKNKIALIGYRLGIGGAERVMANLSVFFDKQGIDVHNIIVVDEVSYNFSGKLINLGKLKNKSNGFMNKLKRFLFLKKYLHENNFDFIIDFRFRNKPFQELLISKLLYKTKTIFTVHSYLIEHYMSNWSFLTRFTYKDSYKIVAVTNKSKELIEKKHQLLNVKTIYNPINIDAIHSKFNEPIDLNFEFVIGMGQMDSEVKQFDKLIISYANSNLPNQNVHLVLLGDGKKMLDYIAIAKQNNIDDKVHFLGYINNPYAYLKKAKFFILSSLNEGMPNVILEALACETPVVSFDCLSGPNEMIMDKNNGLLVENQNIEKLSEAMNLFIEDEKLYNFCKENAFPSCLPFSIDSIGQQWLELMQLNN